MSGPGSGGVFRNVLAVVIATVIALSVLYGIAVLVPSSPALSPAGQSNPLVTVGADVVLFAPFNGTTVSVVATVSSNASSPLVEPLAAQYRPTGNGSTAVFSSYYGTFVAAVVNLTNQAQAVNVTVTVSYGGTVGTGNGSVGPGEETVMIPVVMGTVPQLPAENMTVSDGATDCVALGGSWDAADATCIVDEPTVVTSLTIGNGTTLVNDGFFEAAGDSSPTFPGPISGGPISVAIEATFVNNGFLSAGLSNCGIFVNEGTLYNGGGDKIDNCPLFGTISNYGVIDNSGRVLNYGYINNFAGGTIYNNGVVYNGLYGVIFNHASIYNAGAARLSSDGTIWNYGSAVIFNSAPLYNYGPIHNFGTINNQSGLIVLSGPGNILDNQPIGGSVVRR